MKKLFLILAAGFILAVAFQAFAEDPAKPAQEGEAAPAVNAGNNICPVCGEKTGQGGMRRAPYEYQGKIYNLCCLTCIDEFKKDPEKYINKVNEELKSGKSEGSSSIEEQSQRGY